MPESSLIRTAPVPDGAVLSRAVDYAPERHPGLRTNECCAYNLTRGCLVCFDIEAADFSPISLKARLASLGPEGKVAFWILPFRGISPASVRTPLDLIFLDRDLTVLDAVESFPLARPNSAGKPATSVLVLPAHSIAFTRTQRGDQLLLGPPAEVKARVERVPSPTAQRQSESMAATGDAPPSTAHPDAQPLAGPGDTQASADRPENVPPWVMRARVQAARENAAGHAAAARKQRGVLTAMRRAAAQKSWLQRWLHRDPPDPRRAARLELTWLDAYFFTGGTPRSHRILNISATGVYVLTEERWYVGTVVRITFADRRQPTEDRSLTVHAKVIRWGNDGVGFSFLLEDEKEPGNLTISAVDVPLAGVYRIQVERFLDRVQRAA